VACPSNSISHKLPIYVTSSHERTRHIHIPAHKLLLKAYLQGLSKGNNWNFKTREVSRDDQLSSEFLSSYTSIKQWLKVELLSAMKYSQCSKCKVVHFYLLDTLLMESWLCGPMYSHHGCIQTKHECFSHVPGARGRHFFHCPKLSLACSVRVRFSSQLGLNGANHFHLPD